MCFTHIKNRHVHKYVYMYMSPKKFGPPNIEHLPTPLVVYSFVPNLTVQTYIYYICKLSAYFRWQVCCNQL